MDGTAVELEQLIVLLQARPLGRRIRRHLGDRQVIAEDRRDTDAEVLRAAVFVDGMARRGEPVLLCGDFNVGVRNSRTLADLTSAEWGFGGATPVGVDHILVRDLDATAPVRWPEERRLHEGRLLSDHTPVDREIA